MHEALVHGFAAGLPLHPRRLQQTVVVGLSSMAVLLSLLGELSHLGLLCVTCFEPAALFQSVVACDADAVLVHAGFAGEDLPPLLRRLQQRGIHTVVFGAAGQGRAGPVDWADVRLPSELPSCAELAPWLARRPEPAAALRTAWGPLLLDRPCRRGFWMGCEIDLTQQQFRLLWRLCDAAGAVVSVRQLAETIYDGRVGDDRARVMGHVRRIRRLIEADPAHSTFLLTVRGEGFRLAGHDELPSGAMLDSARGSRAHPAGGAPDCDHVAAPAAWGPRHQRRGAAYGAGTAAV
jgi:hypothetical protein